MSELDLYKKMYAKVVGEVDDVLQALALMLAQDGCGRDRVIALGERLKQALQDAEEMYLDADVEPAEG